VARRLQRVAFGQITETGTTGHEVKGRCDMSDHVIRRAAQN